MAINTSGFQAGREQLAKNADEFVQQMYRLGHAIELDFEKLVRVSVLRVFSNIVKASPVDTGAYRASHGIANGEVSDEENIKGPGKQKPSTEGWTWRVGDGVIILYNNQPYAEVIEFGGYPNPPMRGSWNKKNKSYEIKSIGGFSKQAPQGVYSLSIAQFAQHVQQTITDLGLDYYKGKK